MDNSPSARAKAYQEINEELRGTSTKLIEESKRLRDQAERLRREAESLKASIKHWEELQS